MTKPKSDAVKSRKRESASSVRELGQHRNLSLTDLTFRTATELAAAIRERRLSSVELLDAHLDQLRRHNPALNAIVTLNEKARERAGEADVALARGEIWGPLHGVPATIKDSFATAGIRTTSGYPPLADYVPTEDATVVARLKAAGAIVLGKTNMPILVQGFQSDNPIFGRSNNPWDLTRTPGGSTGGGAAALAAGMSPLEIGSDYGGSVRIPAHYCGLFSIKPTERRVPLTGHIPELPGSKQRSIRHVATPGPLARSLDDLILALQLISGPDHSQPEIPPLPLGTSPRLSRKKLRVAWNDNFGDLPITRDTRAALHKLLARLDEEGCTVEQLMPEGFDFPAVWETYGELRQCEIGSALSLEQEMERAVDFGVSPTAPDPEMRGMGTRLNATLKQYTETLTKRDIYIARVEQMFESWDVFVCPVTVGPAFPHCKPGTPIAVDEHRVSYRIGGTGYTSPFNLTGNPSVVIPLTRSKEGLPIGVQLVGPRWGEMKLLAAAKLFVEVTGPFQRPPGY